MISKIQFIKKDIHCSNSYNVLRYNLKDGRSYDILSFRFKLWKSSGNKIKYSLSLKNKNQSPLIMLFAYEEDSYGKTVYGKVLLSIGEWAFK